MAKKQTVYAIVLKSRRGKETGQLLADPAKFKLPEFVEKPSLAKTFATRTGAFKHYRKIRHLRNKCTYKQLQVAV